MSPREIFTNACIHLMETTSKEMPLVLSVGVEIVSAMKMAVKKAYEYKKQRKEEFVSIRENVREELDRYEPIFSKVINCGTNEKKKAPYLVCKERMRELAIKLQIFRCKTKGKKIKGVLIEKIKSAEDSLKRIADNLIFKLELPLNVLEKISRDNYILGNKIREDLEIAN